MKRDRRESEKVQLYNKQYINIEIQDSSSLGDAYLYRF